MKSIINKITVLSLTAGVSFLNSFAEEKLNVLLICVDDLNDWIGVLKGHPGTLTPHLDRLAQKGVSFTNTYCQAPLSGPSRASFLTGLYPFTTGIYGQIEDRNIKKNSMRAAKTDFLPEYFEKNGYKTQGVGKVFHKGDDAGIFNEYGGHFGIYGPKPEKRMNYDPEWFGKPKGTSTDWGAFPEHEDDMPDYKATEWAVGKLKEKHEKPFFLAVGLVRPHVPWHVPQEWFDLFPLDEITTPPYNPNDMDDIPEIAKKITEFLPAPDMQWVLENNKWEEIVQAYLACVAYMDHKLGEILKALDESDYGNNTVVVFFGDNGYDLGQKGRFAKHALWRTATHVPLIISAPGYDQNRKCTANVGLIDIYPTLTDVCNLPDNPANEGRSLKPLLKNTDKKWEYITYSTYGRNNHALYWNNLHYIRYHNGDEELYNLNDDIDEWNNLASESEYKKAIRFFRKNLPAVNEQDVSQNK